MKNPPIPLEQIKANRAKWVKALRSGRWKQGTGRLHCRHSVTGKLTHCCLGVASRVCKMPPEFEARGAEQLTLSGAHLLGLDHRHMFHLIYANDSEGKNFSQIADMIEALPMPIATTNKPAPKGVK
jgi:hypothetical protein